MQSPGVCRVVIVLLLPTALQRVWEWSMRCCSGMPLQLQRSVPQFGSRAAFRSIRFTLGSHSNAKPLFVNERIRVWFVFTNHTVITTDAVSAMIIITVPSASTEQTFVWSAWRGAKLACGILAEIRWLFSAWIAPTPTHVNCEGISVVKVTFLMLSYEIWVLNYELQ